MPGGINFPAPREDKMMWWPDLAVDTGNYSDATMASAVLFCTSAPARPQEPQGLVSGMNAERTLGPRENQVYTITLQEGTAVIGEAVQHGVDLVIDVFGPDGKLIRTVDSPNGS